jgi:endonuclease/exonuclease/phosphatase family metal-dependent hydrolase
VPGVPDDSQPQLGQVAELIQVLATSFQPNLPTIVVGDFNSNAGVGASYLAMAGSGYTDVWNERIDFGESGFTCCQDVVLTHPDSRLSERIDLVWTKNLTLQQPVLSFTVGDRSIFRTRTRPRLWPSDHAGLATWIAF